MGMKARRSLWRTPFAFLGRGLAHYDSGLELCIWLEGESEASEVARELPPEFEDFDGEGPLLFARSGEEFPLSLLPLEARQDPDAWPGDEAWRSFAASIEEALLRIHNRHPIRIAVTSFGDVRTSGLRAPASEQEILVENLCGSDLALDLLTEVYGLSSAYLQARHQRRVLDSLSERIAETMTRDDSRARELLGLGARLLEQEGRDERRRALLSRVAPTLKIALAGISEYLLVDIALSDPKALLQEVLLGGVDPEVAADLQKLADSVGNELCEVEEGRARAALIEVAEALVDVVGDSISSAQGVILLALSGRLDETLQALGSAAKDPDRVDQAVGIAMAEATRLSHRQLIDACLSLSRETGAGGGSPMVVANLMHEQLSQSKFEDAANLALLHLQGQGAMTAALYTNALLAFAATSNRSEQAVAMAERIEKMLAHSEDYFGPESNSGMDMRGSAYAWLGLWQGMTGDIGGAYRNLEAARDIYDDFLLLPTNGSFSVLLARDELRPLFEGQSDRALVAKNKAVERNPRDWWSIFSRGLIQHESGKIQEALADYQRTIELNPEYPDVYINIGNIRWLEDDDLEGARRGLPGSEETFEGPGGRRAGDCLAGWSPRSLLRSFGLRRIGGPQRCKSPRQGGSPSRSRHVHGGQRRVAGPDPRHSIGSYGGLVAPE
jgi:tetratricopeptide (TPR) repeat protein